MPTLFVFELTQVDDSLDREYVRSLEAKMMRSLALTILLHW